MSLPPCHKRCKMVMTILCQDLMFETHRWPARASSARPRAVPTLDPKVKTRGAAEELHLRAVCRGEASCSCPSMTIHDSSHALGRPTATILRLACPSACNPFEECLPNVGNFKYAKTEMHFHRSSHAFWPHQEGATSPAYCSSLAAERHELEVRLHVQGRASLTHLSVQLA